MKKTNIRRALGMSLMLCLLLLTIFAPANVLAESNTNELQGASSNKPVSRFAGIDQYETSSKISEAGWPGTSNAVVLAAGTQANLIDAMSAGPLAAVLKAPILLREPGSITQYQGFVDLYYIP